MPVTTPLPLMAALLAALATLAVLARYTGVASEAGRHASIDGLRGYLALGVFLHHGVVWFQFLQTGQWQAPASPLYTHLGESSVALFFMITSFLFFGKLIAAEQRPLDWLGLAIGRVARLLPLYLLAMCLMLAVVAVLSEGVLRVPPARLLADVVRWLSFTIIDAPDLNGVLRTRQILAGVTWSLPYEWLFYAALPLLGWLPGRVRHRAVPWPALLCSSAALLLILHYWRPGAIHLLAFGGGIVAALLAQHAGTRALAQRRNSAWLVLAGAVALVTMFPGAWGPGQMLLLTLLFSTIACGNTLFGVLTHPLSRRLGDISYSIYLLHGLLLYTCFMLVLGPAQAALLTPAAHWAVVIGLTPLLIAACSLTFACVERPGIEVGKRLAARLRDRRLGSQARRLSP